MQRAVIDTNVFVSALRSRRGAAFRLISLLGAPTWQPVVSVALILEYEEVGKREAARIGLPEWVVESIIDMFCRFGAQHAVRFRLRPVTRDPDDDFLLELAVASQADFLVTYNLRDFRGSETYGIRSVTPGEFLRTIGSWPEAGLFRFQKILSDGQRNWQPGKISRSRSLSRPRYRSRLPAPNICDGAVSERVWRSSGRLWIRFRTPSRKHTTDCNRR